METSCKDDGNFAQASNSSLECHVLEMRLTSILWLEFWPVRGDHVRVNSSLLFSTVLLIEDDASHALLIKRALRDFAREVVHVENVAAALAHLSKSQPAVIITDLNLPDSTSVSHVEKLNQVAPTSAIVMLTSSNALQDAVEAMKLGARDFIVKNFTQDFKEVLGLSLMRLYTTLSIEEDRRRLQREMAVLRVAIENSNDGLAVVTEDRKVIYCNTSFDAFINQCGGNRDDILSIFTALVEKSENLKTSFSRNLEDLAAGGAWQTELSFVGQKSLAFSLSLSSIPDPQELKSNTSHKFVVWLRDISDQKRREKFQREILSTTTHDLKGPLGAIMISADLLTDMVTEPKRAAELILRIGSSATGAINLIDEFLSARRIQEGSFILKPIATDLAAMLTEVVQEGETIAAAKGIVLTFEASGKVNAHADKLGLSRVVTNLVSNALKFTPRGGKVKVTLSPDQDQYHILVSDTGAGMEAAEVNQLFQRFSRLEKHSDVAGTGLGLFVVKSIVQAHSGTIEITSKTGQGTTFDVVLPVQPPVNERGELICLDFS